MTCSTVNAAMSETSASSAGVSDVECDDEKCCLVTVDLSSISVGQITWNFE